MKIIRNKIFETNSSSSHSIIIPTVENKVSTKKKIVHFYPSYYGRYPLNIIKSINGKASYLYSSIYDSAYVSNDVKEMNKFLDEKENIIRNFLNEFNIRCKFHRLKAKNTTESYTYGGKTTVYKGIKFSNYFFSLPKSVPSIDWESVGIDHGMGPVLNILNSSETLYNYLFNKDSIVITGGDEYEITSYCRSLIMNKYPQGKGITYIGHYDFPSIGEYSSIIDTKENECKKYLDDEYKFLNSLRKVGDLTKEGSPSFDMDIEDPNWKYSYCTLDELYYYLYTDKGHIKKLYTSLEKDLN